MFRSNVYIYNCIIFFIVYISIIKSIIPEYEKENGLIISRIILFCCSIETFYIIFNFLLATLIKPGSVSDIINSKYYKNHNPYISKSLILPQITLRLNDNNSNCIWKRCKYCKIIKPLRTHHCAICNNCIFKMDHHCPWINNCVGQNNHRYFLLFLFHVLIFSIHITLFAILTYFFTPKIMPQTLIIQKKPSKNKINFICIMGITGVAIELFFATWNWFLAFNGNTTFEFWASKVNFSSSEITNFSFNSWRENLYYIFGQKNIFKILYIPDFKKLPFSGIEVSKFVDPNFSIEI